VRHAFCDQQLAVVTPAMWILYLFFFLYLAFTITKKILECIVFAVRDGDMSSIIFLLFVVMLIYPILQFNIGTLV
jgi:hypothetical protein